MMSTLFFVQFVITLIASAPVRRLQQISTTDVILSTFQSEIISSTDSDIEDSISIDSVESTSVGSPESPESPESPDSPEFESVDSTSTPESPESESIEECEVEDGGAFISAVVAEACSVCVCNGLIAECEALLDQEITAAIMTSIKTACPSLSSCVGISVKESVATDFSQGIFPDECSCDLLECASSVDGSDLASVEESSATNVKYMFAVMTMIVGVLSVLG